MFGVVAVARGMADSRGIILHHVVDEARKVQGVGFGMVRNMLLPKAFGASHHFVDGTETQIGHNAPYFRSDGVEEVDNIFRLALEFGTQSIIKCGYSHWAVI